MMITQTRMIGIKVMSDFGCIQKVEPMGFPDVLDVGCKRRRAVKVDMSSLKDGIAFN